MDFTVDYCLQEGCDVFDMQSCRVIRSSVVRHEKPLKINCRAPDWMMDHCRRATVQKYLLNNKQFSKLVDDRSRPMLWSRDGFFVAVIVWGEGDERDKIVVMSPHMPVEPLLRMCDLYFRFR